MADRSPLFRSEYVARESDIAIIGMSCKLPGGVESPQHLWQVLASSQCVIDAFPRTRGSWPKGADYPGIDQGGFVHDADAFDAAFFRISPAEARIIDPQQRMLLELAWACLEDAGVLPVALKGSNTGVFVGASNCDYSRLMQDTGAEVEAHHGVGSSLAVLANRLSYFFDLSGPSLVVDTACSSSLVALHSAVQSLRSGECAAAMVGGVNLICHPDLSIAYHKAGMLSSDGRCKVFDAKANGYVRSEGAVVLLLKPLQSAVAEHNRVLAVIRGSAINHGAWRSPRTTTVRAASSVAGGLTVPDPQKQKELLIAAWKDAAIAAHDLSYIEAHGTGTSVGDPIEIQGMQAAYAEFGTFDPAKPCAIGSVKSNLGHLESAAGITGLLKIILSFQHRQLPASMHFTELNPKISLSDTPFFVQDRLRDWDAEHARVAAVSSFGSGGTNAHVVVQDYTRNVVDSPAEDGYLFVLSAANAERLRVYASRVIEWLERDADGANFGDAIHTWQVGRTAMQYRLAIRVTDHADLQSKLKQWLAADGSVSDAWSGDATQNASSTNRAWQTKAGRALIDQASLNRDFELLGNLWVAGIEVDWRKCHERAEQRKPQCVSVPTYPFARERHWIDTTARKQDASKGRALASVLHPLLHVNASDLGQQRYSATFSGDEFFLTDHQVRIDGRTVQKVLPGVACLEMARAAIERALPAGPESTALELRNVVWVQPIVVSESKQVSIGLLANDHNQVDYEIYSQDGDEDVVHCQGSAVLSPRAASAALDLVQLAAQMGRGVVEPDAVYARLAEMGLVYGPSFQGIIGIRRGDDQLLAQLRMPKSVERTSGEYVLHPSLMDSALQAAVGLIDDGSGPWLPFALDSLRIVAPCSPEMVVWVRRAQGSQAGDRVVKVDIDLCDERGNVCVQMRGLSSRVPSTSGAIGNLLVTPIWEADSVGTRAIAFAEHHVILCELPALDIPDGRCLSLQAEPGKTIAQRYSDYALVCFERIQAIFRSKPQGKVLLQIVAADHQEQIVFAGLSGLLRTAALENPQLVGQILLVPAQITPEELGQRLQSEKAQGLEPLVRYEGGSRQVVRWQEVAADCAPIAFRNDGVYLITGGLGALGMLFAREILAQAAQAKVVLTGRSPISAENQAALDGRVQYRQVDLEDLDQVRQLMATIHDEHGQLSGILHSAGMIADNFILKKSGAEFSKVLAPKVTGTFNLDQASRDMALDFLVLFSSVAGAVGNVGQADYAAANGFMDQFAAYRNGQVAAGQRHGRTLSLNWPLWQDGGMEIDAPTRELLREATGMQPMQTATGMSAFYRSLALPHHQAMVVEGHLTQLRRMLSAGSALPVEPQVAPPLHVSIDPESLGEKTRDYLRRQFSELLQLPPHKIDPNAALEQYGIDSILALKLTNQLEKTFGSLSKTLFFEYQSIRDLAGYFVARHSVQLSALLSPAAALLPAAVAPAPAKAVPGRRFSRPHNAAPSVPAGPDPIAIIGLSGRYPEAFDLAAYWNNLRDGKDCIIEVPKERWDWREYFSDDRSRSGHHYSRWGGFIAGVDEFDPLFFNISPVEAELIDPQERLFLQHAWIAIEDAGYTRATLQVPHGQDLAGQVGVYVGVMYSEYQLFGAESSLHGKRLGILGSTASVANRVSYALDLHGPSITLDTMCSSSLTAIHLACQDLRGGRTSLALAGGVNVSVHPNKYLMLSAGQFISSDGHCQSFGEGGDGYIPGEGVGVVVLKRLSEARRDGDHIYGIIRGSALTHGGKTNGYTVPNPQAQTSAIRRALEESRTDARHISYIEAHGTGTKLGDPIEIAALSNAFHQHTEDAGFCLIGSAKSNIGHCESAAGIAGLTKVLLQMQHRQIVPSLHSTQLNPHIDFDASPFVVNQELRPWEQPVIDGRTLPRIAGISSFGAGGSNAHMIVEEYPQPEQQPAVSATVAILLSAKTAEQLRQKARDLRDFVRAQSATIDLVAMAYTLQVGREAMDERLGFVVSSVEQLAKILDAHLGGEQGIEDVYQGQAKRHKEALSLFSTDADLQQTIDRWIAGGKLSRLLDLWVHGVDVDWSKLYSDFRPRRVSLPTYPFARERYWIDVPASGNGAVESGATAVLHPLLHSNTSDLSEQRYRSTFTGQEFFLADHRIHGRKVLPGVAYLEMARAAIEHALPERSEPTIVELRDVVWAEPIVVTEKKQVTIALAANDTDEIEYEVCSGEADQEIVHCQGRAVRSAEPAPAKLDIGQLEEQMKKGSVEPGQAGLVYGPSFQGIIGIRRGDDQLLAQLRMPKSVEKTSGEYVLHPSLMDSALQASVALFEESDEPRIPFALEALRIVAPCTSAMVAWARHAAGNRASDRVVKVDIDLCDERGNVCVQMRGLSTRALGASAAIGSLLAVPIWEADSVGTRAIAFAEHQVILCELPALDIPDGRCLSLQAEPGKTIAQRYSDYALVCFERIQTIFRSKPQGKVLLQIVVAYHQEQIVFAGLSGLLRTAALENPQLVGQILLVPAQITPEELGQRLQSEKAQGLEPLVRYEGSSRQVVRWQEVAADDAPIAFRNDGVYLITGGLGALGMLFAREILAQAAQAKVVLTGRSPISAENQAALDGRVQYRQVDLEDLDQVRQLMAAIHDEHGQLSGILHSAGMIADNFIVKKSGAEFSRVLAPKVTGTFNLDQASREMALDFLVLFSSVAGAVGNVGQADYAAANGFMDQFAAYRNGQAAAGQRHGRTLSLNWPLWQDGGMEIDAANRELLREATGMQPMQTATGMSAFYRSLALPHHQAMVVEGDLARLRRTMLGRFALSAEPDRPAIAAGQSADSLVEQAQDYLCKQFAGLLKLPSHRIDPQAALETYGIDSVLALRLTNQLEKSFGSLAKTLLFEYQTIRDLAGYFIAQHSAQLSALLTPAEGVSSVAVAPAPAKLVSSRRFSRLRSVAPSVTTESDPIAVIGLSGRYPEAVDLEAYWDNLREGKDCIIEVPRERWDWQEYFSDDRSERGRHYSRWGGFIAGVDEFDPLFFNISPKEAEAIDPQERLFLQHAWMAIEDAGYTRAALQTPSGDDLAGQVGVYAGVMYSEYQLFGVESSLHGKRQGIAGTVASIANRVSYALNLHGPSVTLDTMCSSSLSAIHFACQDLKLGRTSLAIAGGVNVTIHPNKYLVLSAGQFISSDGHCQSFGEGGDGYIPGEGVGVVILKRLSEARRDGDHIYGIIRGSALNHGGKTNGYTVPNPQAQASAIRRALAESHTDARHVSYVEAHGTGTKLGDPIEIAALSKAFQHDTQDTGFCLIGSAKSNIGHCESAAGIAGLTKILLQMQHRQIVPSLHSTQLNPHIDFEASPFVVNQALRPWEPPVIDGKTLPRIAGISSFGAGGSNAHMIIEEYPQPAARAAVSGTVVILLSARTLSQLQRRAADLADFVRARRGTIDLAAMTYTLQVGREAMDERLGFIVSSVEQLDDKLQAYVAGEQNIEDAYYGQVKRNKETLSVFSTDIDLQQTVDKWIADRRLAKLLDLWVKGLDVDWTKLYGDHMPARLSLPTYPFAKERYWIETPAPVRVTAQSAQTTTLHPLLHGNTSDLSEQRYNSTFTGEEFFLADHQVTAAGGAARKVLPGVAYLEMARAAIERALPTRPTSTVLELHNTVWLQPIVVSESKQVSIALWESDGEIEYEIYSGSADEEIVHCQGRAVLSQQSEPARLDLAHLRGEMTQGILEPSGVYAACARKGLLYGPSFQAITDIHQGSGQLLAQLRLPMNVAESAGEYVLHPSLMDGALQACAGLFADSSRPRLPFALASLRIFAPCTADMVAWARHAPGSQAGDPLGKLDIDLCDEQGRVCVRMNGFAVRALEGGLGETPKSPEAAPLGLVTLAPVWEAVTVSASVAKPAAGERVVVIGGEEDQHRGLWRECERAEVLKVNGRAAVEEIAAALRGGARIDHVVWILPAAQERGGESEGLIEAQEHGVLLGFRLIKALLLEGYGAGKLQWTVITNATHRIGGSREQKVDAAHGSVAGLVGSMAKEYRHWDVRLVDVGAGDWPWHELMRQGWDERGEGWAYRDGQWYRRQLVECELSEPRETPSRYKRKGVYVVIGGAGGVGEVLSEHLIRNYDARLVWIGRRQKDDEIEQKLSRVAAHGGVRPSYIAADARNREELERACKEIKERHGRIDGVIHSAIVLADKSLASMAEEQFRAGLSAKVDTAVRLAQVFGREPLDFILYFSSLQSFLKAPGQSNYAAGCTFTDTFADWQSGNASYPVKVMNWGYWGSVGIVAGAEYQERMAQLGVGSIEPEEGMAGVERLLSGPLAQVGMIRTTSVDAAKALGVSKEEALWVAPQAAPSVSGRLMNGIVASAGALELIGIWDEQRREVEETLAKILCGQLRRMGWQGEEPGEWSVGLTKDHERWMHESLGILERHGYFGKEREPEAELWREWEQAKSRWESLDDGMRAQVKLVEATLRSLPAILCGEKRATDVMFPNSSLDLVEGVYKHNAVADYFNGVMATVVGRYVEERRHAGSGPKLRLLELGAGTGGSSEGILQKLDAYRQDVGEYCYSDLSRWFLLHGEQTYGPGRPYLKYAVVDVEKAPEEQGVEPGAYDVVLAANVLHATRRMRDTLRNAKASLKKNGVLVLNEIGTKSVYTHLTFGLLEGWWAYEDQQLRMDGSPGLTPDAWKRVLEEEGFRAVMFPAQEAHGLGQQIIVAESDGIIRQKRTSIPTAAGKPSAAAPVAMASALGTRKDAGLPEKVEEWLAQAVCALLKVRRDDIDLDVELSEFGFDSISLTGFANHVNQAFGLKLMPTIFFEHATLKKVAGHLVQEHEEQLANALGLVATATRLEAEVPAKGPEQQRPAIGRTGRKRGRTQWAAKAVSAAATGNAAEAIAIIGMSARFPGAEDADAFWENLKAGKDSVIEIPPARWDWRAWYGDEREDGNKSSVKWGAFIEGVDEFDPLFFGISPREAELMDPQQRLMMTYGWKAFEDAGYGPAQLWGSRTGIFIGTGNTGYGELLLMQAGGGIEGYSATGLVPSIGPNRLSYLLNLHGPSEPIETACSSSLVAVHRAVRSILSGECEMALVGGVNTLLTARAHISFSKAGMLSRDGKCKTFSSRADGYVRGEGVGMVVLKKLSAAEQDGDHIRGVIRGSAENHGGRGHSLTAPNPEAQAELIKDAYRRAGVSPGSVSYIEAHGTGTALGDPVEVNGLKSAFQSLHEESGERAASGYCGLGSVKSNIGHLELAAGMAGLIKVLLQIEHRTLVASLHCEELSPYIQLEESPFYVVRETKPWTTPTDGEGKAWPLRAGVSSFGFGGVNAHVVMEEYVSPPKRESAGPHGPAMVVLSARNEERLKERARQLRQAIRQRAWSDTDLPALAYTLQVGREAMEQRLAMTVASMQELETKLEAFVEGKEGIDGLYRGEAKRSSETLAVFRGDEELREAVGKWMQRGKWSKVLQLWVKGPEIEWEQLYGGGKPRRMSLPTYPFAREHYWPDATAIAPPEVQTSVMHPLLQRNTSDLSRQRYSSTFTGEEFFLTDHRVRTDSRGVHKVLPGVAYLEMARAATEQALPAGQKSNVLELRDTVWLKPLVVTGHKEVSIDLVLLDNGRVDYEIFSVEDEQETVHCRGHAVFSHRSAPVTLDLERLRGEMDRSRLAASDVYAAFDKMGLSYGPAHQGITEIEVGEKQLLAQLRLPAIVDASRHDYGLHPSLMDGALQACIGLIDHPLIGHPPVPFLLESLRALSACPAEVVVWVRFSEGSKPEHKTVKLDIDVCDPQGHVCVQMHGFATRILEVEESSPETAPKLVSERLSIKKYDPHFDDDFYQKLIADIVDREVSVDEAVELG